MATPDEVVENARPGDSVVGWKLDRGQREELLERFPPSYGKVVADHVTLKPGVSSDTSLPDPPSAEIVGRADDGSGVECMVVQIDGTTNRAGDDSIYHITWSLRPGRKAVESNDLLREKSWRRMPSPIPIKLTPARFR